MGKAGTGDAADGFCPPDAGERAVRGLKCDEALPAASRPHMIAARLADLCGTGALTALSGPVRFVAG
ncbi:hypothetical protein [Actinomadura latina]|uniref:Uncharacterized protein n=1 Tax=Actinomadura latina TaxID=163603 RepID=A0A846Z3F5_9ACTN|nr:hypothetical protein [Actinomadura latina]NKZ05238.1 hypothetical protein [Actinomadura latina]